MKHVLIVDDDYDICEALQIILEPNYRVSVAYDGQQALDVLSRDRVDAVVLDLMMPIMDGEETVREMHRRGMNVPVVFASAATHLASRARASGAAAFLPKPFEANDLEQTLERVLASGGGGPRGGRSGGTPVAGGQMNLERHVVAQQIRAPAGL